MRIEANFDMSAAGLHFSSLQVTLLIPNLIQGYQSSLRFVLRKFHMIFEISPIGSSSIYQTRKLEVL